MVHFGLWGHNQFGMTISIVSGVEDVEIRKYLFFIFMLRVEINMYFNSHK